MIKPMIVLLVLGFVLFGCSSQSLDQGTAGTHSNLPSLQIPQVNGVSTVKYTSMVQHVTWTTNDANGKRVIQKLLTWMKQAKPKGYVHGGRDMKAGIGTASLTFQSSKGKLFSIAMAFQCKESGDQTKCSPVNGDVDYSSPQVKKGKSIRLHSPALANWISRGWKKDRQGKFNDLNKS